MNPTNSTMQTSLLPSSLGQQVILPTPVTSPDLLEQLSARIPDAMAREAKAGFAYLSKLLQQPAPYMASVVASLDRGSLRLAREFDSSTATVAVIAAALQQAEGTAAERIERAMRVLSERYQADW